MNFGPHIDPREVLVHCKLTQVHTPRGSFRGHSNHSLIGAANGAANTQATVPSTDRPETLPPDRNLCVFYNASPKIGGGHSPKKIRGPKTCKISVDFGPHQTLIANVSGTAEDIQNRPTLQTMSIPSA